MTDSSKFNLFEIVNLFLDKDILECCICNENVDKLYIICKSGCINNSYCKKCIENLVNNRRRCPFTNIDFGYDDICLDYKNNKNIENRKQMFNYISKKLGIKQIKNISINIEIT